MLESKSGGTKRKRESRSEKKKNGLRKKGQENKDAQRNITRHNLHLSARTLLCPLAFVALALEKHPKTQAAA